MVFGIVGYRFDAELDGDIAMNSKREILAELAHAQWSGWMEYLFSKGVLNEDGTWTMPAWAVENKKDGFAYSQALAFESLELREKFDQDKKEFNGVTFDDIERYAKIVAYKVANNLKNGFVMDNNDDPLNYGNE